MTAGSYMGVSILKRAVWRGVAEAYHRSGASRARHEGNITILTYHRVLSAQDLQTGKVQPGMYVRAETFQMHMEYLRDRFEVLSLQNLLDRWRDQRWDAGTAYCSITFDDGWLDNYQYAFPILKQYRFPGTIFLPTDYIETSRWFWPERLGYLLRMAGAPSCASEKKEVLCAVLKEKVQAGLKEKELPLLKWKFLHPGACDDVIEACKELSAERLEDLISTLAEMLGVHIPEARVVVNWDEVKEMSRYGISFGSHSCSHRLLTHLSKEDIRREVVLSYETLCASRANIVPVFCYPNGNYNDVVQHEVHEAGYQAAMSVIEGIEGKVPTDMLALKRISLHDDISDTISQFALALSGLR